MRSNNGTLPTGRNFLLGNILLLSPIFFMLALCHGFSANSPQTISFSKSVVSSTKRRTRGASLSESAFYQGNSYLHKNEITLKIEVRDDLDTTSYQDQSHEENSGEIVEVKSTPNVYKDSYIPKTESLLNYATQNIIHDIKPGFLRATELGSISALMAAWTSKKKISSKSNAEVAIVVEKLLKRVIDERKAGNEEARANTRMYTMTIDAWSKSGKRGYAAYRAQSILDSMEQMYKEGDTLIKPDCYTYNAVLNAWSKSGEIDAAERAEIILDRMLKDAKIEPDVFTYTTVIASLKGSGRNSVKRSLELLSTMQKGGMLVRPNRYTFTTLINVIGKSGDSNAENLCLMMIEYMKELYLGGDQNSRPNILTANGILGCLARGRGLNSALEMDRMLKRMRQPIEKGGFNIRPDSISYNIAIQFFCRQNSMESILRALGLLEEMKKDHIQPGLNQYNYIIIALNKLHHEDSAKLANSIVQKMITSYEAGEKYAVPPDSVTFNALINTISRGKGLETAKLAEKLITQMHHLHHSNSYENVKPNVRSFAAVLQAWARSGQTKTAAYRAEEIIHRMEELYEVGELELPPDVYCYTIAIASWANSGTSESDQKAMQLFERMEKMHNLGHINVKPNVRTYNAVIDTIHRSPKGKPEQAEQFLFKLLKKFEEGDTELQPETFTFNAAIHCFTKKKASGYGERAVVILEKMLHLHKRGIVTPDSRSFSHIIEHFSWRKDKGGPETAERLLKTNINLFNEDKVHKRYNSRLKPTIFSFTSIMMGFARTHEYAGERSEQILGLLNSVYERSQFDPKLKPNAFVYNCILSAYSRSGELKASAKRAEEILSLLEQKYKEGQYDMRPNAKSYIFTMVCFAKSKEMGKARKAFNVLKKMKKQYENGNESAQPNVQAYNALMNAVAFTNHEDMEEEKESLDIAKIVMKELYESEYDNANSMTYGSLIKACGNLNLPKELIEDEVIKAFHRCGEEGQVNEYVLTQLRYAIPKTLFQELVPMTTSNYMDKNSRWNSNVPASWSRNVPDKFLNDSKGGWWKT